MENNFCKIISALLLLCICSCDDVLDLTSPTALDPTDYYKTELQIQDAVTGTYAVLRDFYNTTYSQISELPSDNTQSVSTNETFVGPLDKLSWTSSYGTFSTYWNTSYRLIARANTVIESSANVTFASEEVKNRYIGEVKFLRALMYFNLVRFFGEVPVVTKKITSEQEAYQYSRQDVSEVYTQIVQDLNDAEAILPPTQTGANIGRATKGAALALLGKVYLQMENWNAAATTLKRVIDLNVYTLLPSYADVFRVSNNNNAEIVFAVQYTGGTNGEGSNFFIDFLPQGSGSTIVAGAGLPGGQHMGTKDLFDAYEPNDLRKATAIRAFVVTPTLTQYYTYKFYELAQRGEGNQDWPVIRYADVLLMYAEALNKDGKTQQALLPAGDAGGSINKVRARAGLSELPSTLSSDQLNAAIDKERRLELAFEGHRWFDLVRTKTFIQVLKEFRTKYNETNIQIDDNSQYKAVFPIPFREYQLNPKGLYQNLNY